MGQKTHPTGFRIAVTEPWRSRWYANKKDFPRFLAEDFKIRKFIRKEWAFAAIPKVEIERTGELVTVFLHTARPGILIGKKGAKVDKFREDLEKLTGKPVRMKIIEVHRPELEANLVAEGVAEQLGKRINYRRALKKVAETSLAAGAKGIFGPGTPIPHTGRGPTTSRSLPSSPRPSMRGPKPARRAVPAPIH
jgi:small subunit ribosomal protein S3